MDSYQNVLELFEQQRNEFQARAAEGIEKYRKGNCKITLFDKSGNAVKGAKISVNQKTHNFKFGANLFMLDELETKEKNAIYKQYFKDTFNMATLPFYWDATEPEKSSLRYEKGSPRIYRRPPIDLCMEFCQQNGIEPREHALAYDKFFPKWLHNEDNDTVKRELERRYSEISERYADKIPTIEVTNEVCYHSKGNTKFSETAEYTAWCFKLAEKYFSNNILCINEVTRISWDTRALPSDQYYANIEATLLKGARIDTLGMQYHLFFKREEVYKNTRKLLDPMMLYRHLDNYAVLGKPLHITEVTIPAYSNADEDEAIQAAAIEHLYTLWFSHPNVDQIVYWNLVDGYAHLWSSDLAEIAASQGDMTRGENYYYGGLLRFDMTPKPAYYTINNLINKVWHTQETLQTNNRGETEFRGFYGTYEVKVNIEGNEKLFEIDFSKNGNGNFSIQL